MNNSIQRSSSYIYSEGDENNPETAFSKLMSIPEGAPIVECKMLLDTMKEESLFEKHIIKTTFSELVPKHIVLERARSDNYKNYGRNGSTQNGCSPTPRRRRTWRTSRGARPAS